MNNVRLPAVDETMSEFEIFSAARLRDFPVLSVAIKGAKTLWPDSRFTVAVPSRDVAAVRRGLAGMATVIDENTLLDGFDRDSYSKRPIAHFPRSFGWYLQQFLKIEYCRQCSSEYCLVWDADTVPLVPLKFLDGSGRILLTKADEFHHPYFHTFRELFGAPPPALNSFISQHMFVDCSSMRAMCKRIEETHCVSHWTEALARILEKHPDRENLFSEYETYANYMLLFEPDKVAVRDLRWSRSENRGIWTLPRQQLAEARAAGLSFAAYESNDALLSRILLKSLENSPEAVKKLAVIFALRRGAGGSRMEAF